ncbi:MAG: tRNA (adenine(22)-N(1))-methyltransferase TrmK [Deltaproteobacteria bacterium]|nr:tRNA (adenine(22)-N(1))-methyltransferase TrmK [Deltaproteobacteria bacterium]
MTASPRVQAITRAIPDDARGLVEVGYDRGLVLDAVRVARPDLRLVGVEIQPGAAARVPPSLAGIDLRTGDGLAPVAPGEVDGVIMAGLGARTMLRVLASRPEVTARLGWLVLCPSHFEDDLRPGLDALGWHPDHEVLAHERDRFYEIVRAAPGPDPAAPDAVAARWGPRLLERRDPLLPAWLADLRVRFRAAFAHGLVKATVGQKLASIDQIEARIVASSGSDPGARQR